MGDSPAHPTPARGTQLDRDAIEAIYAAAEALGFMGPAWGSILFDGMQALQGRACEGANDAERLRASILWLNAHPSEITVDGPPLALWLANAIRLADGPEGDVFRAMRRRLLGLTAAPGEAVVEPFAPRPWPLLQPYTDPRVFAGRTADVAALIEALQGAVLLGLHAPSGFGKSSALQAGLLPTLRAQGVAAARDATPHEPGVLGRLARALGLSDAPTTPEGLLAALAAPPVLVLDQFEEIFKTDGPAAQRQIAWLLAAVAAPVEAGLPAPARVVLSYREEYTGQVERWLADGIGAALGDKRGRYPIDLVRRFTARRLPAVGETDPQAFAKAISRPLAVHPGGWRFAGDGADRLAEAFADARARDPAAPLVPELQVVLEELMADATDRLITVPAAVNERIEGALGGHLRRHVDAIAARTPPAIETRTRIWLGLRQLTTPAGARAPAPTPRSVLTARLPADILDALSGPAVRAVVPRRVAGAAEPAYDLSHDTLARTVRDLDADEARRVAALDEDVFATERLIAQRVALFAEQPDGTAHLGLDGETRRRIKARLWLVGSSARAAWWAAAQAHARRIRVRWLSVAVAVLLVAAGAVWLRDRVATADQIDRAIASIEAAGPTDGESVIGATHRVLQLRPGEPRLGPALRTTQVWAAAMARPAVNVEAARRRVIRELMTVAETPTAFGYLAAGTEVGRTHGAWTATAYRDVRAALHAELVERFGAPPAVEWRRVPAGRFTMGSNESRDEQPPHAVRITRPFDMMRHEVTRAQWARFYAAGLKDMDKQAGQKRMIERLGADAERVPMWDVTWHEANALAAWLTPRGRLPTEAEWEYAARGGPASPAEWIAPEGWHRGNAGGVVHPVCERQDVVAQPRQPRHPLGLCDLTGNLYEWVLDGYTPGQGYPGGARVDPLIWRGAVRGLRGGSFLDVSTDARPAYRNGLAPSLRSPSLGVRVVRPAPD